MGGNIHNLNVNDWTKTIDLAAKHNKAIVTSADGKYSLVDPQNIDSKFTVVPQKQLQSLTKAAGIDLSQNKKLSDSIEKIGQNLAKIDKTSKVAKRHLPETADKMSIKEQLINKMHQGINKITQQITTANNLIREYEISESQFSTIAMEQTKKNFDKIVSKAEKTLVKGDLSQVDKTLNKAAKELNTVIEATEKQIDRLKKMTQNISKYRSVKKKLRSKTAELVKSGGLPEGYSKINSGLREVKDSLRQSGRASSEGISKMLDDINEKIDNLSSISLPKPCPKSPQS